MMTSLSLQSDPQNLFTRVCQPWFGLCNGYLQPLGHQQGCKIPFPIRLLTRMLVVRFLPVWWQFDNFALSNIRHPGQCCERTSIVLSHLHCQWSQIWPCGTVYKHLQNTRNDNTALYFRQMNRKKTSCDQDNNILDAVYGRWLGSVCHVPVAKHYPTFLSSFYSRQGKLHEQGRAKCFQFHFTVLKLQKRQYSKVGFFLQKERLRN